MPPANLPDRLLLGPGPSPIHPRVYAALATPIVGHLDPAFLAVMDETAERLRTVFGTQNRLTLPVSGTGSAGMEAAFVNAVQPGDRVLVIVNGLFGERMVDVATRCGAEVFTLTVPWGEVADPDTVRREVARVSPRLLAAVHAETSTGALQALAPLGQIARDHDALLLADVVTSLGGLAVDIDANQVDVAYAGTQKCLSCTPGLAPFTMGARAEAVLTGRTRSVQSWYLDMTMVRAYWGEGRVYHHTAPISLILGLHAALGLVLEEGLEARFIRHRRAAAALWAGCQGLGLRLHVASGVRLPSLTTIVPPEGVDEARVRARLLNEAAIEIGGGLGQLRGRVWRVGTMGEGARFEHVARLLSALAAILIDEGYACSAAEALAAAGAAWQPQPVRRS